MIRFFLIAIFSFFFFFQGTAYAGNSVTYYDDDTVLEGYWAPSRCMTFAATTTPTILVIHQWKGLGNHEKERADELATQCYNAFAIDMYGKGIRPETAQAAGVQAGKYKNDPALSRKRLQAALDYVLEKTGTDSRHVAVIGYCFGGTMALELARSGADIAAAVSFHGGLSSAAPVTETGIIKAAIQVHHGADDPLVPLEEVSAFMDEMHTGGADWHLTYYADAVHAFTHKDAGEDPSKGVAYNEKADKRSWAALLSFLQDIFFQLLQLHLTLIML